MKAARPTAAELRSLAAAVACDIADMLTEGYADGITEWDDGDLSATVDWTCRIEGHRDDNRINGTGALETDLFDLSIGGTRLVLWDDDGDAHDITHALDMRQLAAGITAILT